MEEIISSKNYTPHGTLCHVCFSSNRQLFSVAKYADLIRRICGNKQLRLPSFLCWECTAILGKVQEFREKVEYSANILNKTVKGHNPVFISLSQLKISENQITIEIEHKEVNVKHEIVENSINDNNESVANPSLDEVKEVKIKEEVDDTDLFETNVNDDSYHSSEIKIKEEKKSVNKRIKRNINKNHINKTYRNISYEIKDIKRLVREIPLTSEQVKIFMSKEKSNEFYTKFAYKCNLCVIGWKTKKRMIQHNIKYHSKSAGRYQCDICVSHFHRKLDLAVHIRRHYTIQECQICFYRSYRLHMKRHLRNHQEKIECVKCGARFSNTFEFHQHHKELHVLFICDICGKKASSKRIIQKHISRHYEKFECKLCNRNYKTRKSFKRHLEEKHTPETENTYCVQCDKKFGNAVLYKRHVDSSSAHAAERDGDRGPKKVPCPECSRIYSRRAYMMNHYRHVHMKQSKYYCEQCSKHFLNRTKYIDHVKYNHEGVKREKNKLCNICGRGFAANRILINHIRTHTGERPFECEYCGAKFTQKHSMLSHVNYIHLKNKRRSCWQ